MNHINHQLTIFLKLADAVIVTDEQHHILAVNQAYEKITGFSSDEIAGKKAGILRTSYTPLETYVQMKKALREGFPWLGVFINRRKDSSLWHSSITITPFTIEGELYYVGIFRELEKLKSGFYLPEERISYIQSSMLKVLAISCEIRDPSIEEHLVRVRDLTERLTHYHNERMQLGWSVERVKQIAHSSILHDIGKSGIPEGILYKPGPLTYYERQIVEMHTQIGVDIIDKIYSEFNDELITSELETSKNIILYHHEKWNGTGYPHQLAEEAIPIEARIVSVVDVFDALTSARPYKEKWTTERAAAYIREQSGQHFDPELVDSFIGLISDDSHLLTDKQ
ncbi:putative two-component system response regulator [Paenibacillus castaneae]|uniref:HD domain-containing phosphohydrolase n=1 Tax=Paenibacillus castaneae TaxID=474957 RepID=UPI001ABAA0CF|nr:HD domain-containing phosphohydrolase [Paenibacillus castaneae]NIK76266.1 putative two-component system response regulator [Paenibacillus castaneae]